MANKTYQIKIESIFGGIALYSNFPKDDQFSSALGVDIEPDGFLNPVYRISFVNQTTLTGYPVWIKTEPKNNTYYIYDSVGSTYTANTNTITDLGDLNDGGTATGNGAEYYDNYMYFARTTTIARYGPLNGTPAFTDDYWVGVLGKTALTDYTPPSTGGDFNLSFPTHFMKRAKDGKLYFADFAGGQGVIHFISTTKTTVEGDTDNGSTYNAVDLPFGYIPVCIEEYGNYLAIGCSIIDASGDTSDRVKIIFWDPTNSITYEENISNEITDNIMCGMKNVNGVLYILTGFRDSNDDFVRVTRYIGGNTVQPVAILEINSFPLPGAIDAVMNRLLLGSSSPTIGGCSVYGVGLSKLGISDAVFNVSGVSTSAYATVTALLNNSDGKPIIGWKEWGTSQNGLAGSNAYMGGDSYVPYQYFASKSIKVMQHFKIKKVSLFLPKGILYSTITVDILTDSTGGEGEGSVGNVGVITSAKYGTQKKIVLRPENEISGYFSFKLVLNWEEALGQFEHTDVALPILVDYETYDD